MEKLTVQAVAAICHEANRQYCESLGLDVGDHWSSLSEEEQRVTILGVEHVLKNPELTAQGAHENWMNDKFASGWTYGEDRDDTAKVHNLLVDFDQLPEADRAKDDLFTGIVNALRPSILQVTVEDDDEENDGNGNYVDPKPFAHPDGTAVGSALAEALSDIIENPPEPGGNSLLDGTSPNATTAPGAEPPKSDGTVIAAM